MASVAYPSQKGAELEMEQIATDIHKAIKGLGTNDKLLISVIANHSNADLVESAVVYRQKFNSDMKDDVRKDTSGHYQTLICDMLRPRHEFVAEGLHKAMKGLGTDEQALIDYLHGVTNAEIKQIKETYRIVHNKDLEDAIKSETSGNFNKVLQHLLKGNRYEGPRYPSEQIKSMAEELYKRGEKRFGTDDDFFVQFFACNSSENLYLVNKEYENLYKKSLYEAIKNETSGHYQKILISLAKPRGQYWAERLHDAMAGLGTNDQLLVRICVLTSPSERNMVRDAYLEKFGRSLAEAIKGDTSGHYRDTLQEIFKSAA